MKLPNIKKQLQTLRDQLRGTLGPDARPLEIRAAILDAIEAHVEAVGSGRRRFPYNQVAIRVLMRSPADKPGLEAVFADFEAKANERFREIRCEPPAALSFHITYVSRRPASWPDGQILSVDCRQRTEVDAPPTAASTPTLRVQVLRGSATKKGYSFNETTILVGRTAEAKDAFGHRRRNHVAFEDSNSTVSRAHARFKYDARARGYRVLDDGSVHGTVVVRGGATIHVGKRDPRGVLLQSGDEIQFGDATVKILIA